ncbi:hypothetical protein LPJ72_003917 [Coemansia sp. Benny D160-2]|nr:hypothetical protein LPJ72_003917 [Coemansia sp. Benny D160-2]
MPSHSDDDMSISKSPSASPEKPIKVVLGTEPPARKPGRPRLDISAHFQDTGEMANHSHRFVWCIACIKSNRPLFKKDRLPARGDLMQRHLQTCKHVSDEIRLKFCSSSRSSSTSSAGESKARKARIASIISGAASSSPSSPLSTARVGVRAAASGSAVPKALLASGTFSSGKGVGAPTHSSISPPPPLSSSQPASVAVSPHISGEPALPPISALSVPERSYVFETKHTPAEASKPRPDSAHMLPAAISPPLPPSSSTASLHLSLRPPFSSSRPSSSPSSENAQQLPRIRSPQMRSATPIDLPAISRRSHPYYSRDPHHPANHHHHASRPSVARPVQNLSAAIARTPPLLGHSLPPSSRSPHNMRTSPPSVAIAAGGVSEPIMSASHVRRMSPPESVFAAASARQTPLRQRSMGILNTGNSNTTSINSNSSSTSNSNRLRRKLMAGEPAYGIMLNIASPATALAASRLGFDWACVVVQSLLHTPVMMSDMVASINRAGSSTSLVRVPSNSTEWIRWAVDSGAQGIILPDIRSREQLWSLTNVCRDAAEQRARSRPVPANLAQEEGRSPGRHAAEVLSLDFMVIPQIDHPEAVANIDNILSMPGIDAAFVQSQMLIHNQRDRFMTMHNSARTPFVDSKSALGFHPAAVAAATTAATPVDDHREAALERISACGRHFGVPVGVDSADGHTARSRVRQGFLMVSVGSDLDIFTTAAAEQLRLVLA